MTKPYRCPAFHSSVDRCWLRARDNARAASDAKQHTMLIALLGLCMLVMLATTHRIITSTHAFEAAARERSTIECRSAAVNIEWRGNTAVVWCAEARTPHQYPVLQPAVYLRNEWRCRNQMPVADSGIHEYQRIINGADVDCWSAYIGSIDE